MSELQGRTGVVTGAAGGIGFALAEALQKAGCAVVLADVDRDALELAVKELGGDRAAVCGVACDVRSSTDFHHLCEVATATFGPVEIVCLNAGVSPSGPVIETAESTWRWLLEVNLLGVANGLAVFGPELVQRGRGHIVITASVTGLVPTMSLGPYSAVKHAVVALADVLRRELEGTGVGVSVLCPGVVRTRIFESGRTRPEELAGATHSDPSVAAAYREAVEASETTAAMVAVAALDAIRRDEFMVFPSTETLPMIDCRLEELRAILQRQTALATGQD